jgi:hypothetical protein
MVLPWRGFRGGREEDGSELFVVLIVGRQVLRFGGDLARAAEVLEAMPAE